MAKPGATEAEQHEAEGLLKKAFANGEGNTLIPLAMLYLQYPHSFPNVNAQQQISKWQAAGYPEAGLAQVLLYRTQDTYDQHLDDVERICKAALNTTDICYVELATVYQKQAAPEKQAELLKQLEAGYSRGTVTAQRVDSVARVLGDATLGKPGRKTAQALLEKIAPGYPASWVSLAQLLYDFPELGDVDQMMQYLDNGRAADQPRAELLLGKLYYEGKLGASRCESRRNALRKSRRQGSRRRLLPRPDLPPWLPGQGLLSKKPSTTRRPLRATARTAPTSPSPNCFPKARAPSPTH